MDAKLRGIMTCAADTPMRVVHDARIGIIVATSGVFGMNADNRAVGTMCRNCALMSDRGLPRHTRATKSTVPFTSMHLAITNMAATVITPVFENPAHAVKHGNYRRHHHRYVIPSR
jgi:hypothetical protein